MAWETIEKVKPAGTPSTPVPANGITCGVRRFSAKRGEVRYILVQVGKELARAACFTQRPMQGVRLMFGSGADAGKVAVAIDHQAGRFQAKEKKNGSWAITMSAADAAGLFSLAFAPFSITRIEAIRPTNGQPPMFVFSASAEMLAVED